MTNLKFADNLSLPIEAVTQKFAFLGRTGSGKSYGASKLAELFLNARAQIVVLDGIGIWYGLRLSADGKGKGFSLPVFGGEHGDVPLEPQAGRLIGKLLVEEGFSAILDVSNFRKHERKTFATDWAEEFFHRKKTNRSACHFFCEESQMFIPERVGKDTARMVGAFEDIFKLGRNYGLGGSLISQRPQAVNKEVLNQTEILLAFQMTGPHERKAIAGWVADKGMDVNLVDELPSLGVGDAYLWSPQFLQVTKQIHIAEKITYDASSTPTVGAKIVEPKELSPVDVEKIKNSMADVVKRAEAVDPKKLNAEITRLKREVEQAQKVIPQAVAQVAAKEVVKEVLVVPEKAIDALTKEVAGFRKDYISKLERIAQGFEALNGQKALDKIEAGVNTILAGIKMPVPPPQTQRPVVVARPTPSKASVSHNVVEPSVPGKVEGLTKAERLILRAFYWTRNEQATPAKIGFYSGYSHKSGSFSNSLGGLRSKGLLEGHKITAAGEALAAEYAEAKPTGAELREWLRPKLNKCENEILDALIDAGGNRLDNENIAELTVSKYSSTSGSFSNALGRLRSLEAAEGYRGEGVKAADVFFE